MTFDAVIESMPWGKNTYTIIRIPAELTDAAAQWPTRRLGGSIDGFDVNLGLNKADPKVMVDSFVYIGPALQRRLEVGPGDLLTCELAPVDPDVVPVPDDVAEALAHAHRGHAWDRKRPSERRQLLMPIDDAVREKTRADRIAKLIQSLSED
ncbi:YdeI/OmpD-associated family protein [Actinomycetes bacterium M1A6_2h]